MPKESLKEKLEGNELDLSLSNLEIIPWKEMAALPKATHLDLSCNLISSVPENFCSLKHIIKLDLSKNCITELPSNFGELSNLQHLDLLGNKLHILPVSFWELKRLKWLDVKDNPLDDGLKKAAGDCLDDVQCKKCAQQVLAFMKSINSDIERRRQKKLQQERDKEAEQKMEEEKIRQRKKAEKLAEKEKRRREYEALKKDSENEEEHSNKQKGKTTPVHVVSEAKTPSKKGSSFGLSCCFTLLNILLVAMAVCLGLYIYCDMKKIIPQCQQVVSIGDDLMAQVKTTFNSYLSLITGKRK